MDAVVPETKRILSQVRKAPDPVAALIKGDDETQQSMGVAGIDVDPAVWTLKLRLRSGFTEHYPIKSFDVDRFWRSVAHGDPSPVHFFIFDSDRCTIAVNLRHLIHAHALFDPPFHGETEAALDEGSLQVQVVLADSPEPLTFGVDPDDPEPEDDDEGDEGQFRSLLFELDTFVEEDEFFTFVDEDGERAAFRAADVALVAIPLTATVGFCDDADDETPDDKRVGPWSKRLTGAGARDAATGHNRDLPCRTRTVSRATSDRGPVLTYPPLPRCTQ